MLQELPDFPDARIFRVQPEAIPNTFEAVDRACRKFTEQGYEGVVLRHPDIPYYEGRSNHLLKYKFFKEADLRIVGVIDGEGRLAGTLGSLVVEGKAEGLLVRSCVGTGLTDEDRKILSQDSHLVGKVLTVKYQSITDKPDKEGFYSLRFPVVIGVKEDRDFEPEIVSIRPAKSENVSAQEGIIYWKNDTVEAGFQVSFTNRPLDRISFSPNKETLADWKSCLERCRSIDDGIRLIDDLRLTIPQIRAFAEYLGVCLSGCRYIKAEIIKRLVSEVFSKQEVQSEGLFHDFTGNSYAIQRGSKFALGGALADFGHVSRQRRGIALCAGRYEAAGGRVMNKTELLALIRTLQKQVDGLMDAVIAMEDVKQEQPVQVQPVSNDDWMTAKQTCRCLKISETTFYEYIKQGLLPPGLEFGPKSKRWRMSDIEAWKNAKQSPICEAPRRRGRPSRVMKIGAFVHA